MENLKMKKLQKARIKFGVAYQTHSQGAEPRNLGYERFEKYYDAMLHCKTFDLHEGSATIYVILDEKYVFHCVESSVYNQPYCVAHYESIPSGQVVTHIWWSEFVKKPDEFIKYATATINAEGEK